MNAPYRYGINVVPSRNPSSVLFPKQVNIPWANWKCAETGSSWHKWSGPATEHPLPGLTGRIGSALVGYSCSPQETRWSGQMTLRMAVQRCGIDAGCNYIVGVASGQKCLDAAVAAFGNKVTGTRAEAVVGSWYHVPAGCSVQSGGDWAAHYNFERNSSAIYASNRNYTSVAAFRTSAGDWEKTGAFDDLGAGVHLWKGCKAAISSMFAPPSKEQCLAAAVAEYGAKVTAARSYLVSGSWNHVPPGCTVLSNADGATTKDWAAHWNKNIDSTAPKRPFVPVASIEQDPSQRRSDDYIVAYARPLKYNPTVVADTKPWMREIMFGGKNNASTNYLEDDGGVFAKRSGDSFGWTCPQTDFRVNSKLAEGFWGHNSVGGGGWDCRPHKCFTDVVAKFGNKVNQTLGVQSGAWDHIPPGCNVQKGGDWGAYYNTRNSSATYIRGGTAYEGANDPSNPEKKHPAKIVALRTNGCKESPSHTKRWGRLIVSINIEPTTSITQGCSNCDLRFTNVRTGASVAVASVYHWSFGGKVLFFTPRAPATAADINAAFAAGDTITLINDAIYTTVASDLNSIAATNRWEMAVSNGVYRVTWYHVTGKTIHVAGCAVENIEITNDYHGVTNQGFVGDFSVKTVEVLDGRLTLSAYVDHTQTRTSSPDNMECGTLNKVKIEKVAPAFAPQWLPGSDARGAWHQQELDTNVPVGMVLISFDNRERIDRFGRVDDVPRTRSQAPDCRYRWMLEGSTCVGTLQWSGTAGLYQQWSSQPHGEFFDGPNQGFTVSVSDTPCTAALGCPASGTTCARVTASNRQEECKGCKRSPGILIEYVAQDWAIDCKGATGKYLHVHLPGSGRIFSGTVSVNRAEQAQPTVQQPSSSSSSAVASSGTNHDMACYAVQARDQTSTAPEYIVTTDPHDPVFYSTCYVKSERVEWLPLQNVEQPVKPEFIFGGNCLECSSYRANAAGPGPVNGSSSPVMLGVPKWAVSNQCFDCLAPVLRAADMGCVPNLVDGNGPSVVIVGEILGGVAGAFLVFGLLGLFWRKRVGSKGHSVLDRTRSKTKKARRQHSKKDDQGGVEMGSNPSADKRLDSEWVKLVDDTTGKPYYYHEGSQRTTWDRPAGVSLNSIRVGEGRDYSWDKTPAPSNVRDSMVKNMTSNPATSGRRPTSIPPSHARPKTLNARGVLSSLPRTSSGALPAGWKALLDKSSGDTYFYNCETECVQWERPE